MRVAFTGVGHWHTRLYANPLRGRDDVQVVGFCDPDVTHAKRWAASMGGRAYDDYVQMCEQTRPDFVFALGRHRDMASNANYLMDEHIAFAMEKPCGVNLAEVRRLAERAETEDVFMAVPFAYRYGDLFGLLREHAEASELAYASFRYISGPTSRYPAADCGWMLEKQGAGGGTTVNLSIHFLDLACALAPDAGWRVASASMSSALSGVEVDDHSLITLESDRGQAVSIETGYAYPTPAGNEPVLDIAMSACFADSYVRAVDTEHVVVRMADGTETRFEMPTSQVPSYRRFVDQTVAQARSGSTPGVGPAELLRAVELVDQAYSRAGDNFDAVGNPRSTPRPDRGSGSRDE